MDVHYDEVEIASVQGDGHNYRVECKEHRAKTLYRAEWVEVNGNEFSTETHATLSGAVAVEYVPGAGQNPSGVQIEV